METETVDEVLHFKRCFVAFGAAQSNFEALNASGTATGMIVIDGAHLRHEFGGVVLFAVNQDANHHICLLALCICSIENGENCAWFAEYVRQTYPSMKWVMQDEGSSLNSREVDTVFAHASQIVER